MQAYTRAFLVLSHAEIESYLEGWAKEIARASEKIWNKSTRVCAPLTYLLSWSTERLKPPQTFGEPGTKDSSQRLADVVTKLFQAYYKCIKDNHGIKERDVLSLFGPLGVPVTAFSPTLFPNLDAASSSRGIHAHQSHRAVVSVLDPETEFKLIQSILRDLIPLDNWLGAYRRRIR